MRFKKSIETAFLRRGIAGLLISVLIGPSFFSAAPANASSVNYIISDQDLFDGTAMSATRIQSFLQSQGSFLASYTVNDGGITKRASDVLADVSKQYNLSPKFFLVLLQKEQSLISDQNPSQNQLDYALGYGCPSSCSSTYKGFPTQLRAAGKRIRESYVPGLINNGQYNGWGPGITKRTIDGINVTPANNATAILYIYNPYVGKYGGGDQRYGANSLFQKIWNSWFEKIHPDGSLVRVHGQTTIWLIRNGKRSAFLSRSAFNASYDIDKVILIDRVELENYEIGPALRFPEPSLVQVTTGGMFLIVNQEKRPLGSKQVLHNLGFSPEEIIRKVKISELDAYPKGQTITDSELFPTGRLLQSKTNGGIVYVDNNNVKHAIFSKEILQSRFRGQRAERINDASLNNLATGDPLLFRDGELVASRTSGQVFVISNGKRRAVPNIEIFRALGFKTKNIIRTNDRSIEIHPLGEPLTDINQ